MGLLTELYRRAVVWRHKPRFWILRPHTIDRRVFREVVIRNTYQLPPRFSAHDILLDVGAHTGSFAHAALRRGAGVVWCCEPDPANFRLLRHNLQPYRSRVRLLPHAVWRCDQPAARLFFDNPQPRNTSAGRVAAAGRTVSALAFDDVVARATHPGRRVRLLKLDCEGSEWPILLTSRMLHIVDGICGEYHLGDYTGPFAVAGYPQVGPALLERHLGALGFAVRTRPAARAPQRLGLFFAERRAAATRAA
jgi:FkbM family methyltransferase